MAITITTQPTNQVCFLGDTIYFTVEAAGDELTYQWRYQQPTQTSWSNSTGNNSSGSTASMELITKQWQNRYKFQCKITDSSGAIAYSDIVTLIIVDVDGDKGLIAHTSLIAIGDAIRAKTETTDRILPADMAAMIEGIETGNTDFMTEGEYVEFTGITDVYSSTNKNYTITIPCSMEEAPTKVIIKGSTYGNSSIYLMAIWEDRQLIWKGSSSSPTSYGGGASAYADAEITLADGYVTLAYLTGDFAADYTYYVYMWR